jgi:hypothetical protein
VTKKILRQICKLYFRTTPYYERSEAIQSSNPYLIAIKKGSAALLLYVSDTGMITTWKGAREAGR